MLRKLYSLVHQNGCKPDDPDSPMMQEILLPGHLYLGVLSVSTQHKFLSNSTNRVDLKLKGTNSASFDQYENHNTHSGLKEAIFRRPKE